MRPASVGTLAPNATPNSQRGGFVHRVLRNGGAGFDDARRLGALIGYRADLLMLPPPLLAGKQPYAIGNRALTVRTGRGGDTSGRGCNPARLHCQAGDAGHSPSPASSNVSCREVHSRNVNQAHFRHRESSDSARPDGNTSSVQGRCARYPVKSAAIFMAHPVRAQRCLPVFSLLL